MDIELGIPTSPREVIETVRSAGTSVLELTGMSEVVYTAKDASLLVVGEATSFMLNKAFDRLLGNFPQAVLGKVE